MCGTHELMHRRMSAAAKTERELQAMLGQRRRGSRRGEGGDELGIRLSEAFAPVERRRTGTDRRS